MNPEKWRNFRAAFVVTVVVASLVIYDQRGFRSFGLNGLGILILAFAAVGLFLYFYVKDKPEDPFQD